jgi:NmrA-like family
MVEERMDIYTLIRNSVVSYAMRDGEYTAVHTVETKEPDMILIVGASGRLGSAVAQHLLEEGKPVRVMTRTPSNLIHLKQQGAEVVSGDLRNPASLIKCLPGSRAGASSGPCPRRKGRQQSPHG